jgi:nickel-dependent lactate racemase
MHTLHYGKDQVTVEIAEQALVEVQRLPPSSPLADVQGAVRAALEQPVDFPPLRRALTPDDRVAVILDEHLPRLGELLAPVLEHITQAQVAPQAITLLLGPPGTAQGWVNDLPEAFEEVRIEVHDPTNRKKLSYLATTRGGRRIYVNRTVVDADQVVILGRPDADPLLHRGGAGLLFPALSDEATRQELAGRLSRAARVTPEALRREAGEIAWLLGAPFLLQVVEGAGDDIAHVVGGLLESGDEGRRLYAGRWQETVGELADTIIATVTGEASRHDFAALARALAHAAQVVQPDGRILLLTQAAPSLGPGANLLRQVNEPAQALELLHHHKPVDLAAAVQWAAAAERARIFLLSNLPANVAEELFVTPLEHVGQVAYLLQAHGHCLILEDADKALPRLATTAEAPNE